MLAGELLEAAAARAGRARGAFAAEAALAAARGGSVGTAAPLAELLRELIRTSGLVRRIGVNLNQAVARLNATGQRSGDLVPYAAESMRRAERLDAVAERVRKAMRGAGRAADQVPVRSWAAGFIPIRISSRDGGIRLSSSRRCGRAADGITGGCSGC